MKRLTGMTVRAMFLATAALSATVSSAGIIHVPFADEKGTVGDSGDPMELFRERLNNIDSKKMTQSPSAPESSSLGQFWSAGIDLQTSTEAEIRESQVLRLSDGCYIGIYTCGAGQDILEGHLVKLTTSGDVEWDTTIQANFITTADKVSVGEDGRFYVLGTTSRNNLTQSYIACFDENGEQQYLTIQADNADKISPATIKNINGNTVACYVTSDPQNWGTYYFVARWFDNMGNQIQECIESSTKYTIQAVSELGNQIVVPMYSNEAFLIDIAGKSCEGLNLDENYKYYDSCVNGDALYTLYSTPFDSLYVKQYKVENGELVETWSTTTNQQSSSYTPSVFAINDGRILTYVSGSSSLPSISVINPDGTVKYGNKAVDFGAGNGALTYSAAQDQQGNIHLFGMDINFVLTVLTISSDLQNPQFNTFSEIEPGYTLYYTDPGESYFTDGMIVFSGFMRPSDYMSHGYTPFYGTLTFDDEMTVDVIFKGAPGTLPKVIPSSFTVDNNGNVYCIATSGMDNVLTKINSEGITEWTKTINDMGLIPFKPVILSNGNIATGFFDEFSETGFNALCYSPEGELIWVY